MIAYLNSKRVIMESLTYAQRFNWGKCSPILSFCLLPSYGCDDHAKSAGASLYSLKLVSAEEVGFRNKDYHKSLLRTPLPLPLTFIVPREMNRKNFSEKRANNQTGGSFLFTLPYKMSKALARGKGEPNGRHCSVIHVDSA